MHLDEAVERFLTRLSATRAPHTVKAYGTDLAQLAAYALEAGIERVEHLNERLVRSWLDSHRAASRRTRERKLSSLRAFLKFCRTMGWLTHDPSVNIALPVHRRPLPRVLTQPQAEQLMQATEPDDEPLRLRDRAILELLYATGVRVSELAGLDVDALDMAQSAARAGQGRARAVRAVWAGGARGARGVSPARAPATHEPPQTHPRAVSERAGRQAHHAQPAPPREALRRASAWTSARTRCATRSPPICWTAAQTCVPCRSCSDTAD